MSTTALLFLPKLTGLDDVNDMYLGWQSLLWRGGGVRRGVEGEDGGQDRRGQGRAYEQRMKTMQHNDDG